MSNGKYSLTSILPIEIWEKILSYCRLWDFARFRVTCKRASKLPIVRLPPCFFSRCSSNHHSRLNQNLINKLNGLQYLKYNHTELHLSSLNPLTNLTKLKYVNHPYEIQQPIIFDKLPKLESLQLFYDLRDGYDLATLNKLTKLKLIGNYSSCGKELNVLTNLLSLDIVENYTDFNISGLLLLSHLSAPININNKEINMLTNLLELDLNINLCSNVYDLNCLRKLTFLKTNNLLNSSSIQNLTNLREIIMMKPVFPLGKRLQLTKLVLWSSRYDCLNDDFISGLDNLIELELRKCISITRISHLTNLKKLIVFESNVPSEEIVLLTSLESLSLDCSIRFISLGHLTRITSLKCPMFYDNFKKLTALKELDSYQYHISDINYFPNLTKLVNTGDFGCSRHYPHNLIFCTSVVKLILQTNNLSCIDHFPNLTYLEHNMTQIRDFVNQITGPPKLRVLKGICSNTALLGMTNLEKIQLNYHNDKVFPGKKHVIYF